MKFLRYLLLMILVVLVFVGVGHAHKITMFIYIDSSGMVHTETYFSDGTKAKNAKVRVYDNTSGKLLLQGHTDNKGIFNFKVPKITDLKIVVDAELGHRSVSVIKKERLVGLKQSSTTSANPSASVSTSSCSAKELNSILDKKLKPLYSMLIDIQQRLSKPTMAEVVGGIGYIVGIFGLIAFVLSRRK